MTKRVLATGVFDIIHPGHIAFLKEARRLGDELVVIVARDKTALERKKRPVVPEEQRLAVVRGLKPVDKAVLGSERDMFSPLEDIKPDVIVLGHDQEVDEGWLIQQLSKRRLDIKVKRLKLHLDKPLHSSRELVKKAGSSVS